MRRVRRRLFQRHLDDLGDLLIADGSLAARAWLVVECRDPAAQEPVAPLQRRLLAHVPLLADLQVRQALFVQQDHAAPIRMSPRRARPPHKRPELVTLDIGQVQRCSAAHRSTPEYPHSSLGYKPPAPQTTAAGRVQTPFEQRPDHGIVSKLHC